MTPKPIYIARIVDRCNFNAVIEQRAYDTRQRAETWGEDFANTWNIDANKRNELSEAVCEVERIELY